MYWIVLITNTLDSVTPCYSQPTGVQPLLMCSFALRKAATSCRRPHFSLIIVKLSGIHVLRKFATMLSSVLHAIPSGQRLHNYRKSAFFDSVNINYFYGHGFKIANLPNVYQAG